jgi:alkyl hydroperoxide reductase subunit D
MTNLKSIISAIPDYAQDIKANIENLLSEKNTILSQRQIFGTALACAYSCKEEFLMNALKEEAKLHLNEAEIEAVKIATSMMAMNNIYYRFVHLTSDEEYKKMPVNLQMNAISEHGISKIDFEIFALGVSIINGCSGCIDAHSRQIIKHKMTKEQIQMVAKIASVINAAANIFIMEEVCT